MRTVQLGLRTYNANIYDRRINVWDDTKERASVMPAPPSHIVRYDESYELTRRFASTAITVVNEDTIETGMSMPGALCHNFSDICFAGGYVAQGSSAQEESIMRRSNFCSTLLQSFYPLGAEEGVYSPCVTFFKRGERDDWAPMEHVDLAFASIPALKRPYCVDDRLRDEDVRVFRKKVRLLMQTAHEMGHASIVTGAWGCGAWGMPARHVAEIFRDELAACDGAFETVCFAIIEGGDSHERPRHANPIAVFREVLCPV
ncbi:hypothetical protein JKP88DRAFT_272859 [Tribonema minus]|uniref:Microbial-type PARG catalytic domain-containing protein n=1 Tax=Tribonema minus TaxID=303371 RepID=A0A836CGG9_9STRA|nr:hypothetical protein JKP88DRAFT_272859 [Tribonema minus]